MTELVWLRNDLRVEDNPALAAAAATGRPVVACYLVAGATWRRHGMAPRKVDLIRRRLHYLSGELARSGIPLKVVAAPWFSDAPRLIAGLMAEAGSRSLRFNREYLVDEERRDQRVCAHLSASGLATNSYHDGTLVVPGAVRTGSGDIYKVFTPFKRALIRQLLNQGAASVCTTARCRSPAAVAGSTPDEIDAAFAGLDLLPSTSWPASRDEVWHQLCRFLDGDVNNYQQQRDLPAVAGTSRLSPAFTLGMLGVNEVLDAMLMRFPQLLEVAEGGAATWLSELIWREFYRHLCALMPHLVKEQPFKPETTHLPWRQADDDFAAWCQGRTGFPIVDAAMRQLQQSGWMHNRLRMIVASFLTKHLLIDWRRGADFFMRHLIDGDFAANNGGWQWAASTGCDAVPYFRIFNPISQSERFDGDGAFIRQMVPELAGFNQGAIHDPHGRAPMMAAATGYPLPIVDLREGRERALAAFTSLKELL